MDDPTIDYDARSDFGHIINPVPYLEKLIDDLEQRIRTLEVWAANHDYQNWITNMGDDL